MFAAFDTFVADVSNLFRHHSPKRARQTEDGNEIRNPFGANESEWLESTLTSTLHHFGQRVDTRFKAHEKELVEHGAKLQELQATVKTLTDRLDAHNTSAASNEFIALQASVTAIQPTITEIERKLALSMLMPFEGGSGGSAGSSGGGGAISDIPYEHRTSFKLGNLGWTTQRR